MNMQGSPEEQATSRDRTSRAKRTIAFGLLIVFLAALGYAVVLFLAGSALQDAPFAGRIGAIRERLRSLTNVEPPEDLPPVFEGDEGGIALSPSPVVASPLPVPTLSPSFIPPPPDAPSRVIFVVEFENTTGVRLTGVRLTSTIPSGTRLLTGSVSPAASVQGSRIVWDLGTVNPEASGRVEFRVLTTLSGPVTSESVMTSNEAPDSRITTTGRVP